MPKYEFRCKKCGHEEDRIVAIKDRDRQKCGHREECPGIQPSDACKGKMERTEEISTTGRMSVQWAGWSS